MGLGGFIPVSRYQGSKLLRCLTIQELEISNDLIVRPIRSLTCACEKLVPQVGPRSTRPKALASNTSAAAIAPPGQNILENDK
jgi:hypothetical protein